MVPIQDLTCEEQPLQYYTHCTAHRVNIVAQYVNEPESIISILTIVNKIRILYYNSIIFRYNVTSCK